MAIQNGYVIVNLLREFYTGAVGVSRHWTGDLSKAKVWKEEPFVDAARLKAMAVAEPMSLKTHVVKNYGEFDEAEVFRNFTSGRGLTWGRWEVSDAETS